VKRIHKKHPLKIFSKTETIIWCQGILSYNSRDFEANSGKTAQDAYYHRMAAEGDTHRR
jgi:hypothetical protein